MRFDDFWTDDDQEPVGELAFPADGRYTGTIVRVRSEKLDFMARHGADGQTLVIDVEIPRYRTLNSKISVMWRGKIGEICRSARVRLPARGEDWDEQQLVGKQVVIETVLGIGEKTGKEYCRIDKWHAQTEPLPAVETATAKPAASATARTQAAKVQAAGQGGTDDEFPF